MFKRILTTVLILILALISTSWAEELVVADFSSYQEGTFPADWKRRGTAPTTTYLVRKGEKPYLEAKSAGAANQIAVQFPYRIKEYPYLSWEWKAVVMPPGGDESRKKTCDSVAAVYVALKGGALPKFIKYVWSSSLPVGSRLKSPFSPLTKMVVVRNQESKLNTWYTEKVNVLEDLKKFFPRHRGKVRGIAFMTDSDNTQTSTEAHLGRIVISTK